MPLLFIFFLVALIISAIIFCDNQFRAALNYFFSRYVSFLFSAFVILIPQQTNDETCCRMSFLLKYLFLLPVQVNILMDRDQVV